MEVEKIYSCFIAKPMCKFIKRKGPDGTWTRCVRTCLQKRREQIRYISPLPLIDIPLRIFVDHPLCFSLCLKNPDNPLNPFCNEGLLDYDISPDISIPPGIDPFL